MHSAASQKHTKVNTHELCKPWCHAAWLSVLLKLCLKCSKSTPLQSALSPIHPISSPLQGPSLLLRCQLPHFLSPKAQGQGRLE